MNNRNVKEAHLVDTKRHVTEGYSLLPHVVGKTMKTSQNTMLDEDRDLIIDESLARNEYPAERIRRALQDGSVCLALRVCTQILWDKYKDKTSKGKAKWTLARAINTGVRNPSSIVGCHAGDMESYDDFEELFLPIIKAYHVGFDPDIPVVNDEQSFNPRNLSVMFSASTEKKVLSTRIRCARNLSMFPMNPAGSRQSRLHIASLMEEVYADMPGDLDGNFLRHSQMSEEQTQKLIEDHLLFRGRDKLQAASGYHQYWPDGRGIFLNYTKTFVNWINEGDHLRLISIESGANIRSVYEQLHTGIKEIEGRIQTKTGLRDVYLRNSRYGHITCCPTNLGTAMRASVHMRLPRLVNMLGIKKLGNLVQEWHVQIRGTSGEHSDVIDHVIDLSNRRRLGVTECELVEDMIRAANYLAHLEDTVEGYHQQVH